jgi:aldehyde dehydrogenase (NAD+)
MWTGQFDRLFIGGEWQAPSGSDLIDVISPATEEVIATVPSGTTADVDKAVGAARRAFDTGPWRRSSVAERVEVLSRFRDL